jgi:hypothetical protein
MASYVGRHREEHTPLGNESWALFMASTSHICPLTLEQTYQVRRVTQKHRGGETRTEFYRTQAELSTIRSLISARRKGPVVP